MCSVVGTTGLNKSASPYTRLDVSSFRYRPFLLDLDLSYRGSDLR